MKNDINIDKLKEIILSNLENKSVEFKRVFHGRGNFYEDFNYLVVDSINDILLVTLFEKIDEKIEANLIKVFDEIYAKKGFKSLIIQRRYLKENMNEAFRGKLPQSAIAIENGLKYNINFSNQNIGIFSYTRYL